MQAVLLLACWQRGRRRTAAVRGPSHSAPAVAAALAQSALESRAPLAAGAGDPQMRAAIIASLEVGWIMWYIVYIPDTIKEHKSTKYVIIVSHASV